MTCRPVAADLVIVQDNKVVLIKRAHEPFKGMWALPGGRLEENETIEECALREGKEETSLTLELVHLIGVYSDPARDPRKIVAIAYLARPIAGELTPNTDALEARWVPIEEALRMPLAADHNKILNHAWQILQSHPAKR